MQKRFTLLYVLRYYCVTEMDFTASTNSHVADSLSTATGNVTLVISECMRLKYSLLYHQGPYAQSSGSGNFRARHRKVIFACDAHSYSCFRKPSGWPTAGTLANEMKMNTLNKTGSHVGELLFIFRAFRMACRLASEDADRKQCGIFRSGWRVLLPAAS